MHTPPVLRCTALYCTVLCLESGVLQYCTVLHCTALYAVLNQVWSALMPSTSFIVSLNKGGTLVSRATTSQQTSEEWEYWTAVSTVRTLYTSDGTSSLVYALYLF